MSHLVIATVVAATLVLGGLQAQSPSSATIAPSVPTSGRELFVASCASCHGQSGRGDGPVADSLRVRPANLTQFAIKNGGVFPTAKLQRVIDGRDVTAHGTSEMPVWGTAFKRTREGLDDPAIRARIDAIVRYLESLQERAG